MNVNITWTKIGWKLNGQNPVVTKLMEEALGVGIKVGAIWIIGLMQRLAPVKTGLLRDSGSVWFNNAQVVTTGNGKHPSSVAAGRLEAVLGFNTDYAAEQDTRSDFVHPKGGEAGYFSNTLRSNVDRLAALIAREAKKVLDNGGVGGANV